MASIKWKKGPKRDGDDLDFRIPEDIKPGADALVRKLDAFAKSELGGNLFSAFDAIGSQGMLGVIFRIDGGLLYFEVNIEDISAVTDKVISDSVDGATLYHRGIDVLHMLDAMAQEDDRKTVTEWMQGGGVLAKGLYMFDAAAAVGTQNEWKAYAEERLEELAPKL